MNSGSDIEYQRRPVIHKDRKRKRYQSSSDEELGVVEVKGEKPIISTRKSQQKQKADEILNDPDPGEFFPCENFICVSISGFIRAEKVVLKSWVLQKLCEIIVIENQHF